MFTLVILTSETACFASSATLKVFDNVVTFASSKYFYIKTSTTLADKLPQ